MEWFRYKAKALPPLSSCNQKTKQAHDFGLDIQTDSSLRCAFMSLHALCEFGRGGRKSSGLDWQSWSDNRRMESGRGQHDLPSRGLSGFGDNDIVALIKIHITHLTT